MTSQLRKINNVIERILLPLAEAVSGWSTLAAIRSALIVTLPLMFLGSLAELMISFPLDAYKEFMFRQFGPEWRMFGQILKDATFSVMSSSWFSPSATIWRTSSTMTIRSCVPIRSSRVLWPLRRSSACSSRTGTRSTGVGSASPGCLWRSSSACSPPGCSCISFPSNGCTCICRGDSRYRHPQAFNAFIPGMLTVLVFAALGAAMQTFVGMSSA